MAPTDRLDPPPAAGELETLLGFLHYQRRTLLQKAAGLSADQLARPATSSALTLSGLLKHLALVEESWLLEDFRGLPMPQPWASVDWQADRDWEFHSAVRDDPVWLVQRYRDAWATVDRCIEGASLDDLSVGQTRIDGVETAVSLRWILLHLIEETARHNGHADLIREAIDGATGE